MKEYVLNNEQFDGLCSKIQEHRIIPFLPFIYEEMSEDGFTVDNHNPWYEWIFNSQYGWFS